MRYFFQMKRIIVIFFISIFVIAFIVGKYNNEDVCDISNKRIHKTTKTLVSHSSVSIATHDTLAFQDPIILDKTCPHLLLQRLGYSVSYNKDTKCPNWVAWHLTADHTDGPVKRMSNFYEDDAVPSPRATLEDYKGSGWSRGHMCPAGDNKWDETAMYESFSLVNVCPQNANLNSGLWNRIEMDCRQWAQRFGSVYIVCGPLLYNKEHETIGVNKVVVPEAFFKVILCLQGKPKAIGFVVKNNAGTKKKDQYVNSVDEVERITGYDFFPALPDSIEEKVEAYSNIEDWR